MPYDPRKPYLSGEQYINDPKYLSAELAERVRKDVRTLCTALGYDINTVEFAIKDGVPYAIDFMNPAPDADLHSVGEFYHNWVTQAVTDLVFKRLAEPATARQYRWDSFLNPTPQEQSVDGFKTPVAVAAAQGAGNTSYSPVQELATEVISGVEEVVTGAAAAVSEIVEAVVAKKPRASRTPKDSASKTASKSGPKRSSTRAKKTDEV